MRTYKEVLGLSKKAAGFGILSYGSHAGNDAAEPYQGVFGAHFNWAAWKNLLSRGFNSIPYAAPSSYSTAPTASTPDTTPVSAPKAQPVQTPVSTAKTQSAASAAPVNTTQAPAAKPAVPTYKSPLQKTAPTPVASNPKAAPAVQQNVPQTAPGTQRPPVQVPAKSVQATSAQQAPVQSKPSALQALAQRDRQQAVRSYTQTQQRRRALQQAQANRPMTRAELQAAADTKDEDINAIQDQQQRAQAKANRDYAQRELQKTPIDKAVQAVTDTVNEARIGARNAADNVGEAARGAVQGAINFVRGKQEPAKPYEWGSYNMNTPRVVYGRRKKPQPQQQQPQQPEPVYSRRNIRNYQQQLAQEKQNKPAPTYQKINGITMTKEQADSWRQKMKASQANKQMWANRRAARNTAVAGTPAGKAAI